MSSTASHIDWEAINKKLNEHCKLKTKVAELEYKIAELEGYAMEALFSDVDKKRIAELERHILEFKQAVFHYNRSGGDMNPLLAAATKQAGDL